MTILLIRQMTLAGSGDDFNDNSRDSSKWGPALPTGHGMLIETNQRLEYICRDNAFLSNASDLPWLPTRLPYNADWEVQLDVFNSSVAPQFVVNSIGLSIVSPRSGNGTFLELFSSAVIPGLPYATGFRSQLDSFGNSRGVDSHVAEGITNAAIRISFDSTRKVFNLYVDTDVSDGYQWLPQSSFGIAGSGGSDANSDWGLSDNDQFAVLIYGFSNIAISNGQIYADNFMETGDVEPLPGVNTDPTGSFIFRFPTNDSALAAIMDVSGNYTGIWPGTSPRNYDINLTENGSGQLFATGTIEGIQDVTGSTQLNAPIGTIKTINGVPVALIKLRFNGMLDGSPLQFSGSGIMPVQLIDLGGTNGFSGTVSYKSKVGGVANSGKKQTIQFPAPSGAAENLHKEWMFRLELQKKGLAGSEQTVASGQLTLPDGETIVYPDRVVRYSSAQGYSLSFKGGTNISATHPAMDPKSSITIKGMKLLPQGPYFQPTTGTITYQFLGQRGAAALTNFIAQ